MYRYNAKLVRVIDGDTIDAMIDLGFGVWIKRRIRLAGLDAPETRTRDKAEKKRGLEAKTRLETALKEKDFTLSSHGVGKYGRCIADIYVVKKYLRSDKYQGKCINEMLIKEGYAKRLK